MNQYCFKKQYACELFAIRLNFKEILGNNITECTDNCTLQENQYAIIVMLMTREIPDKDLAHIEHAQKILHIISLLWFLCKKIEILNIYHIQW